MRKHAKITMEFLSPLPLTHLSGLHIRHWHMNGEERNKKQQQTNSTQSGGKVEQPTKFSFAQSLPTYKMVQARKSSLLSSFSTLFPFSLLNFLSPLSTPLASPLFLSSSIDSSFPQDRQQSNRIRITPLNQNQRSGLTTRPGTRHTRTTHTYHISWHQQQHPLTKSDTGHQTQLQ